MVNTRNTKAVNGVNSVFSPAALPPNRTVRVETTLSFAINPVIKAVDTLQSPNPRGAKIGAAAFPIIANRLSSGLDTRFRPMPKFSRNHTTMVAKKMTVNAFCAKSFAFSQISWPTLLAAGSR